MQGREDAPRARNCRRGRLAATLFAVSMTAAGVHAQQAAIARANLAVPGVSIEITRLERVPNQKVVEMSFVVVNGGAQPVSLRDLGLERESITSRGTFGSVAGVALLDLANGISYGVAGDSAYNLSSRWSTDDNRIPPGGKRSFWAWFGAPPASVAKVAVHLPGTTPIVDLPLATR